MTIEHGGDIFAIARQQGWDWKEVLDFSASINPLGPSPRVRQAICGAIDRIVHYPEREPVELTRALGHLWDIDPERILLGNGATDLIHFIAQQERPPDVTLVVPTFSEFHRAYPDARQVLWTEPESWPSDSMLVVTNPNNPYGDIRPIERDGLTLLDESFIEFTGQPSAVAKDHPATIVLRSLTKFYALPGLRIGAVVADADRIRRWRARRPPWQVNVLAEAAALAAISDQEHADRTLKYVAAERAWLADRLSGLPGIRPHPSCANYMLLHLDVSANWLRSALLPHKILVRKMDPSSVRIAVRSRAENERLIAALESLLCA